MPGPPHFSRGPMPEAQAPIVAIKAELARADAPNITVQQRDGGRVRISERVVLRGREVVTVLPRSHALGALRGVADDAGPIAVWRALGKVARHCAAMGAACLTDS